MLNNINELKVKIFADGADLENIKNFRQDIIKNKVDPLIQNISN